MVNSSRVVLAPLGLALLATVGCAAPEPKDYSQFREHQPTSILVLPPTNQSVEVNASYSVMSTITTPLAAAGYYVYPVAVVDTYFKENGLPTPADMHSVPLDKLDEVFGADAVMYLDVRRYGQDYDIVSSNSEVDVNAKLVDVDTGLTLWEGRARGNKSSAEGNSGGGLLGLLITAAVAQAVGTTVDAAHGIAVQANQQMILGPNGLLLGPYHEGQAQDPRGVVTEDVTAAATQ